MRATIAVVLASCSLVAGCGARGGGQASPPKAAPANVSSASEAPAALPSLSGEERAIEAELRAIVLRLATEVGERHAEKSWNLAETTDDLARRFEKMGYAVRRQGFTAGEDVLQ